MIKRLLFIVPLLLFILLAVGCGERAEVYTTHTSEYEAWWYKLLCGLSSPELVTYQLATPDRGIK